jgi:hypothetical protein
MIDGAVVAPNICYTSFLSCSVMQCRTFLLVFSHKKRGSGEEMSVCNFKSTVHAGGLMIHIRTGTGSFHQRKTVLVVDKMTTYFNHHDTKSMTYFVQVQQLNAILTMNRIHLPFSVYAPSCEHHFSHMCVCVCVFFSLFDCIYWPFVDTYITDEMTFPLPLWSFTHQQQQVLSVQRAKIVAAVNCMPHSNVIKAAASLVHALYITVLMPMLSMAVSVYVLFVNDSTSNPTGSHDSVGLSQTLFYDVNLTAFPFNDGPFNALFGIDGIPSNLPKPPLSLLVGAFRSANGSSISSFTFPSVATTLLAGSGFGIKNPASFSFPKITKAPTPLQQQLITITQQPTSPLVSSATVPSPNTSKSPIKPPTRRPTAVPS